MVTHEIRIVEHVLQKHTNREIGASTRDQYTTRHRELYSDAENDYASKDKARATWSAFSTYFALHLSVCFYPRNAAIKAEVSSVCLLLQLMPT